MRTLLVSAVTAGLLALPGLSALPAQADPSIASDITPSLSREGTGSYSFSCSVVSGVQQSCGDPMEVPAGDSLYVRIYDSGDVWTADFIARTATTYLNTAQEVDVSDDTAAFVWKNDTGSTVTVYVDARASYEEDSGSLDGTYLVAPF